MNNKKESEDEKMNTVILMGRLTRDPEIRYGDNGNCIARYSLAVDRRFKRDGEKTADFFPCVAFGKAGEFVEKHLRKGTKILVTGRLQTGQYDKDGQTHYTTDVIVEAHYFCESKNAAGTDGASGAETGSDGFMNIPDDIQEQLPFN